MKDELSIIVYSCWKNRDMWEVFTTLFKKYWKDCCYHVILVTDVYHETDKKYVFTKIIQIDDTWAKMIKRAISEAGTPYVSLFMDDYLLCDYVRNEDIKKQLERTRKYHASNMRLIESPICRQIYQNDENVGCYRQGEAYCLSLQVGIWDSSFLEKIIKDEWSAWDFERIASLETYRCKKENEQPILVALDYEFPYEEGVRKGKWMQQGARLCKRNGIKLNANVRPIMTNLEMSKIYFFGAVLDLNGTFVVKLQNLVNRIKNKCSKKN